MSEAMERHGPCVRWGRRARCGARRAERRRLRRPLLAASMLGLAGVGVWVASASAAAWRGAAAPADEPVVEMQLHPSIRALTATLANGVRVHHRFMPYRKGQATVEIALAAGRLDETGPTRGLTDAAVGALATLLRNRLDVESSELAPINERRLALAAWAAPQSVHFRLAGPTERLPEALALLTSQFATPDFEQAHLDAYLASRKSRRREGGESAFGAMWRAVQRALHPGPDADRLAPAPIELLEQLALGDVRRWAKETLAQAPIEVAIVGDAPRAEALRMLAATLGDLPGRAMTTSERLALSPAMPRPKGLGVEAPVVARVVAASDGALVFVFLETPKDAPPKSQAALEVFAEALPELLAQRAGDEPKAGDVSFRAYHRSGGGVFDKGILAVHAFVPFEHAHALAERLAGALAGDALPLLDDAAVARARKAVARRHDEQLRDPQAWASLLIDVALQGQAPAEIAEALAAVEKVRAQDVHAALASAGAPGGPGRVIVMPARSEDSNAEKEDDPTRRPSHPPGAGG